MSASSPPQLSGPSHLSPILCDSPAWSSFFWACVIIGGIGSILAAYDPSSVSFLGSQSPDFDIYACYIAGALLTLMGSIQLIRLIAYSHSLTSNPPGSNPSDVVHQHVNDPGSAVPTAISTRAATATSPTTEKPAAASSTSLPLPPSNLTTLLVYIRRVSWMGSSPYVPRESASDFMDLRPEALHIRTDILQFLTSAMQKNQDNSQNDLIVECVQAAWDLLKTDRALQTANNSTTLPVLFKEILHIVSTNEGLVNRVLEIYRRDNPRFAAEALQCTVKRYMLTAASNQPNDILIVRHLLQQCPPEELQIIKGNIDTWLTTLEGRNLMHHAIVDAHTLRYISKQRAAEQAISESAYGRRTSRLPVVQEALLQCSDRQLEELKTWVDQRLSWSIIDESQKNTLHKLIDDQLRSRR